MKQVGVMIICIIIVVVSGICEIKYLNKSSIYLMSDIEYIKNAINNNNYDLAETLLKHGANANHVDCNEYKPVIANAIDTANPALVRLLLQYNAGVNTEIGEDLSVKVIDYAKSKGNQLIIDMIEERIKETAPKKVDMGVEIVQDNFIKNNVQNDNKTIKDNITLKDNKTLSNNNSLHDNKTYKQNDNVNINQNMIKDNKTVTKPVNKPINDNQSLNNIMLNNQINKDNASNIINNNIKDNQSNEIDNIMNNIINEL